MCRLRFPPRRSPSGDERAHKLWEHHTWSCDLQYTWLWQQQKKVTCTILPSIVGSTQKGLVVCAHEQPTFSPKKSLPRWSLQLWYLKTATKASCTITSHKLAFLHNLLQLHNPAAKENQHKLAHAVSWIIITNESHETFLCNNRIPNLFHNCQAYTHEAFGQNAGQYKEAKP